MSVSVGTLFSRSKASSSLASILLSSLSTSLRRRETSCLVAHVLEASGVGCWVSDEVGVAGWGAR